MRSLLAVLLVTVMVLANPGAAQEAGKLPLSISPVPPGAPSPVLGLGLATLSDPWPGRLTLFNDYWMLDLAVVIWGPPTLFGTAADAGRPVIARLRSFSLGMRFDEKVGADGRRVLVLAPLARDWDDLTGWEKFGLTLQYAGAAAAIGHFVSKVAH